MYKTKIKMVVCCFFYTLFCFSFNVYAQEFQITNTSVYNYSIDRFTNEIYYQEELTEKIYKTNRNGSFYILTDFTSLPQFSNNNHRAAYINMHSRDDKDLYLYDFDKDSSYFLINSPLLSPDLLFSPSDNKILVGGDISGVQLVYYSFEDSCVHDLGFTIYPLVMEWLSDTTIIYLQFSDYICKVNIKNFKIDTLVVAADFITINGLAYNKNINAFAYSWDYNSGENSLVNLYYISSGFDSTIYNFLDDGPSLGGFEIIIRSLRWEQNSNKLGFIGRVVLNPFSFIYAFNYNTSNTHQYSDWENSDGIKYDLNWLNKDTILYTDATDYSFLFGLDVTRPVYVHENSQEIFDGFNVAIYPNPFNSTTKISINLPASGELSLELYNSIGEIISKSNSQFVVKGNNIFSWNELFKNNSICSGIYFIKTLFYNNKYSFQKTNKLIYLK